MNHFNLTKLLLSTVALATSCSLYAQDLPKRDTAELPKWHLSADVSIDGQVRKYNTVNTAGNYRNAISTSNAGHFEYKNGIAISGSIQAGYFIGKKRKWGIGTGIMYQYQAGQAQLHDFRMEYQASDAVNNTFRQVLTARKLTEKVRQSNINIPLVLKYQSKLSKQLTLNIDGGILLTALSNTTYKTDASLDYEAIYKFQIQPWGATTTVYDNSILPEVNDWLITRNNPSVQNTPGGAEAYFNDMHARGYNVALDVKPDHTGTMDYSSVSVGFILRPTVSMALSKKTLLDLGVVFMHQSYTSDANSSYVIGNVIGDYNSPLNTVSSVRVESFGVNVGLTYCVW